MISLTELIKDKSWSSFPKDVQKNLMDLLEKGNKIRTAYGKPMIINRGYSSPEEQIAIYKKKGITDLNKIPMHSAHLVGAAMDVNDPKQELQKWCLANLNLLESVGLWCEDFKSTPVWVHLQIYPPKSGNRFFIP